MSYKKISLRPISGSLGAIVEGVDLSEELDDETYAEIKQALLGAIGHDDLRGAVIELVFLAKLTHDRTFQFCCSIYRWIFRFSCVDGFNSSFFDVIRRIKIRLTSSQ